MSIGALILVGLVILLIGSLPSWPYSRSWGYYPTGGFGILIVVLILWILFTGHPTGP